MFFPAASKCLQDRSRLLPFRSPSGGLTSRPATMYTVPRNSSMRMKFKPTLWDVSVSVPQIP